MSANHIHGIDVSHHNGAIDWRRAAAGLRFAYAKASEGVRFRDRRFAANYAAMKANGLFRGAYHFFHPALDIHGQCDNFLACVDSLGPGDLPPALDLEIDETRPPEAIADAAGAWLEIVERTLGRAPIIYSSARFWKDKMADTAALAGYRLWVAHYTTKPAPAVPPAFPTHSIWQYTDKGAIDGIDGRVDLNRFNGSIEDLAALAAVTKK